MKSTTRIPIWRTIVNWVAVVLLGSIIAPILLDGLHDVETIVMFVVISAVCSLPAVGLFILVNWAMNGQQLPTNRYRMWQGLIHFGASLVTFVFIGITDGKWFWEDEFLLVVGATYTGLGQIAWWLTFYSREHMQSAPETNDHPNNNV